MKKVKTYDDCPLFLGTAREIKSLWNALFQRSDELMIMPSHCCEPKFNKSRVYGLLIDDSDVHSLSDYRIMYTINSEVIAHLLYSDSLVI